jgi:hypothetical protein
MKEKVSLPGPTSQITIVGQNGSGKTVAALWHLSMGNFDRQPWIIFDYKNEEEINSIPKREYLRVGTLPKRSGIYIVQPEPGETQQVKEYLDMIRRRERIGIYIDEGYQIPDSDELRALLTQGRSKRIPRIILAQRPSWVSRFFFSEANFFQVYYLVDDEDHKRLQGFFRYDYRQELPRFHSWYYDAAHRASLMWAPVPPAEESLQRIEDRLKNRWRVL